MPEYPDGRLFLVTQSHRDPLDFEILFQCDVEQFHIKGKPIDPGMSENKIRSFFLKSLEPALSIEKIGGYDGSDKPGKKHAGELPKP